MALLITFLMSMFFILQMFTTHRIIHSISFGGLQLNNQFLHLPYYSSCQFQKFIPENLKKYISLELQSEKGNLTGSFFKSYGNNNKFKLEITKRGHYPIKRIKFYTLGPGKLFYVWRYFTWEADLYIYPEKLPTHNQKLAQTKSKNPKFNESEFTHHIRYQKGLSVNRIDWKVFARTDQLYWKKFIDFDQTTYEVNYSDFNDQKEVNLKYMSYLIDKYYLENKTFRVVLPNRVIPPGKGPKHYHSAMEQISGY